MPGNASIFIAKSPIGVWKTLAVCVATAVLAFIAGRLSSSEYQASPAQTAPPTKTVSAVQAPVATKTEIVYLSDLPETEARFGTEQMLGKSGELRFYFLTVDPKSVGAAHALSAHAPSHLTYHLLRKFKTFRATASMNATSQTPQTFRVKLDGRVAWQSMPMQEKTQIQAVELDVSGVGKLELETDGPENVAAHTVWLEPCLVPIEGFKTETDMPVLRPAKVVREELVGKSFIFSTSRGNVLSETFTLAPNGEVTGYSNANEARWDVDSQGRLQIRNAQGLVTCRFDRMLKWGSRYFLEGSVNAPSSPFKHCLDGFSNMKGDDAKDF